MWGLKRSKEIAWTQMEGRNSKPDSATEVQVAAPGKTGEQRTLLGWVLV